MSSENTTNLTVEEEQTKSPDIQSKSAQVDSAENQPEIPIDQVQTEAETLEIGKNQADLNQADLNRTKTMEIPTNQAAGTLEIDEPEGEASLSTEGQKSMTNPTETEKDDETLAQMQQKVVQQRERRSKKRNDRESAMKDQRTTRKKIEEAKSGEENSDDDFANPRPREPKDKTTAKAEKDKNESAYRCGLQPSYKIIKLVKEKKALSKKQLELLKRSPFFNLFNVFYEGKISLKECKKYTENLDAIYKCYSAEEGAFIFGKEKMTVTAKDISLLFGLPMLGNNIEPPKMMTSKTIPLACKSYALRNFGSSTYITRPVIEDRIKKIIDKEKEYKMEDLPTLLIMDIVVTFFFPNNQQKLRWGLLQYLCDMEKMKTVSWPLTIEKNFHKFVKSFIHNPRNMSGCAMLPLYCICEKMKIIKPRCSVSEKYPRFARWDLRGLKEYVTEKFLNDINEGEVHEISDMQPHELKKLETADEISSKSKRSEERPASKKRKCREQQTQMDSFEDNVSMRVLKIHIDKIEAENKKLKKDLTNERFLRREAEKKVVSLEQQLQGRIKVQTELPESDSEKTKSDSHSQHNDEGGKSDNENVDNDNENVENENVENENENFETAEKTNPDEQSSEIRKNVSVEVNPPNFDFGITQIIKEIQEERKSAEQQEKKMPSKDDPPSYVNRIKKRERKKTRRDSFDYPTISKKKGKKTSIEAGKNREDQPREESEKGKNEEQQHEEKQSEKTEKNVEQEPIRVEKPLAIVEASWAELNLSHCDSVKYLNKKQAALVKEKFSVAKARNLDVMINDDTILGGCVITKRMLVNVLEGTFTDGQIIDWFTRYCALTENNYAMPTMGTKALADKIESLIKAIAVPILEKAVINEMTEIIYFPLHCEDHWTLVTLSYANMQWAHFDSNRPRRSTTNTNGSLKAALALRAVVEELLPQLWQKHNVTNKQLSTSEMLQEKCAQQDCNTLDCAIYVMVFIISMNKTAIPLTVAPKNMLKCRAQLVYEILASNGYCWDLADFMSNLS